MTTPKIRYNKRMHDIQKILLKRLLSQNSQKYSVLTRGYNYDDNIVFHLKQLLAKNFIKKEGNLYTITLQGIQTITTYDLTELEDKGFKTFFLGFLCKYEGKYLIKEHLQGTINFYNLPSGKPWFGEQIESALSHMFKGNTQFALDPKYFSFRSLHVKTVKTSSGEILFDDAFAIYDVAVNKTQYDHIKLKKGIHWMTVEKIKHLPNRWPEIDFCILKNDTLSYQSYTVTSNYILGGV